MKKQTKPFEPTAEELESVNPYLFIKGQNIKDEKGIPLSFKDRAFLIKPLCDMSPLQAWLKSPQIGATVTMTIKAFHTAKNYGKDIIYTLPTQSDVYDMAGGKINRIVAQNPELKKWIKNHDTVEQKNVGDNIIYYRGTFTTKQAMMVSSQLNIHDEVDASNPEVITQYETRQQAEAGAWRWYFSHPSIVGAGIDKYWSISDQQEWFIKCSECGEEQFMEWPLSVDQERQCFQCKFCQAVITDQQRREGVNGIYSWRRKYTDKEFVGYHISQLICPWITAAKVIKDFKEKEAQYFHNFVLALPYADNKSKVTLETIKGLLTDERQDKGRILFGVDTGIKIRWVYGDMNGLIEMGECDTYEELQRECNKHKDWIMVIDQGGDIIGVRQFAENNKGKVFLCTFVQDKKSMNLVKWGEGDEYGRVLVDRNKLIQLTVDEMNDKRILLYGNLEKWWNMWLHWSHMYRIVDEDRMGNLVYVWERSDRNDYCFVASTKIKTSTGDKSIEDIIEGELVYTRQGLRKVLKCGITEKEAQTYVATFSNGAVFEATGNHPVYTKNRGFVALDALCYSDILEEWNQTQSFSKEKSTDAIQSPIGDSYDATSTKSVEDSRLCIEKYGNPYTGKSRKVLPFITRTKILLTTRLIIYSSFLVKNISHFITGKDYLTPKYIKEIGSSYQKSAQKLYGSSSNITILQEELLNDMLMRLSRSRWWSQRYSLVPHAKSNLPPLGKYIKSFVQENALRIINPDYIAKEIQTTTKIISMVHIRKTSRKKRVYNLFVEDTNEYYANNILVHNCLAMCYYRVAYERFAENESTFEGGSSIDDGVPEAPYRYHDGTTDGIRLTLPTTEDKSSDWRYN